ncbi:DUF881 domain-containing protein [Kitasatospora sp. NPDC006697]|uniref:DUF881 domain-containing protein n=1 Tax=Kitasatospora sp. NPDC006697 TaxID=3364020 RepID=UPI003674E666
MPATRSPNQRDGRYARPDASMTLLNTVMDQSLDEGYAAAARARGEEGRRRLPTTARGKLVLAIGLALAAVVVTVSGVTAQSNEPALAKEHDALVQRVNDENAAADKLQQQVEAERTEVEQEQRRALSASGADTGLTALNGAVGTGAVSGPGLKLVIDDSADSGSASAVDPRAADGFAGGRLRDRDLQLVVNGLWEAGAEAVSVNGQRITALSPIRAAGDAILVDNRPLVPPYTLLAVGDEKRLPGAFQSSMGGRYLKILVDGFGIRETSSAQRSMDLPAAVGFTLRLAVPEPTDGPGAGPSPAVSPSPSPVPSASPSSSASAPPSGPPSPSSSSGAPTRSPSPGAKPSRTGATKP